MNKDSIFDSTKQKGAFRYVEKLVENLEQKRSLEGRYERMRTLMIERIAEAREAAAKAQIDLKHVSDATRVLQKQVSR